MKLLGQLPHYWILTPNVLCSGQKYLYAQTGMCTNPYRYWHKPMGLVLPTSISMLNFCGLTFLGAGACSIAWNYCFFHLQSVADIQQAEKQTTLQWWCICLVGSRQIPPKPDWPLLLEPDHLHFLCHYSPFNASLPSSVGWFGRAMALLPVSEGNGFVGGTHRDDEQYPNADLVSPGPDERAFSFSRDDSITLGSCRTAIKS